MVGFLERNLKRVLPYEVLLSAYRETLFDSLINRIMERDNRIDTLKGVLVTLVVFGHCFIYGSPMDGMKTNLSNWIYLFHMPFFVFLSGYFTHPRTLVSR